MRRIAVFVSGGGTNLQAVLDAQRDGVIKSGEAVLTLSSNPDAFALTRAREAGIACEVLRGADFSGPQAYDEALIKILKKYKIDLVVLAGFMRLLGADFCRAMENRIINVHPSLIPSFCGKGFYGLKVHEAALEYGVKVTGATVHFVNEVPDGGKIISQKSVEVLEGDTPQSLQKRVMEQAEWAILPLAVEKVCADISKKEWD